MTLLEERRKKRNAYYRLYRITNRLSWREYRREYNKQWRKKNGYHNEKKWDARNPEKIKAHSKLKYAIRIGKVTKKPCEVCGKLRVHGHHPDYSRPYYVRWLCPLHHVAVDRGGDKSV